MLWQSINFQGAVTIDKKLIDLLSLYLQGQEKLLASELPTVFGLEDRILESFEEALSYIEASLQDQLLRSRVPSIKFLSGQCNLLFWKYIQVLEGAATELLQQLERIRFDKLNSKILDEIDEVFALLQTHIHRAKEALKKLEILLETEEMRVGGKKGWQAWLATTFPKWFGLLDPGLGNYLDKAHKALNIREEQIKTGFKEYEQLDHEAQGTLSKFEEYKVLQSLEPKVNGIFKELYRLLKMWATNLKTKVLPEADMVRTLRMKMSVEKLTTVLNKYHKALSLACYDASRALKSPLLNEEERSNILRKVEGYSKEDYSLVGTISRFRDFLLRTDPNPYVRARLGFTEKITGMEPLKPRQLQKLAFEVEGLGDILGKMIHALHAPWDHTPLQERDLYHHSQNILHELAQPLASHSLMKSRAAHLVDLLWQMDEVSSCDPGIVEYMGDSLSYAMRADWRYHVLHENQDFHKLYKVHCAIAVREEDPEQLERLELFKEAFEVIKSWLKKGGGWWYTKEVEEAVESIKGALTEFLIGVESPPRGDLTVFVAAKKQQLLELRYLFGEFFLKHLQKSRRGGDELRDRFLFVDQSLELIDNRLSELV